MPGGDNSVQAAGIPTPAPHTRGRSQQRLRQQPWEKKPILWKKGRCSVAPNQKKTELGRLLYIGLNISFNAESKHVTWLTTIRFKMNPALGGGVSLCLFSSFCRETQFAASARDSPKRTGLTTGFTPALD